MHAADHEPVLRAKARAVVEVHAEETVAEQGHLRARLHDASAARVLTPTSSSNILAEYGA